MPLGKLPDEYISTREAAAILGCGPASIETGLRTRTFPIGMAWCTIEDNRRGQWNYRIPRRAFIDFVETGRVPTTCKEAP